MSWWVQSFHISSTGVESGVYPLFPFSSGILQPSPTPRHGPVVFPSSRRTDEETHRGGVSRYRNGRTTDLPTETYVDSYDYLEEGRGTVVEGHIKNIPSTLDPSRLDMVVWTFVSLSLPLYLGTGRITHVGPSLSRNFVF